MVAKKKTSRKVPTPALVMDADDGDLAAVKAGIKSGADVNAVDRDGRTALHQAVVNHHVPVVKALLAANADAAVADGAGFTPLHFAARELHAGIVKLLLDAGATVDAVDRNGNTPLLDAVFAAQEDPETIRLLLAAGADKTRKNNHGVSPIDLAADSSNASMRKWLA